MSQWAGVSAATSETPTASLLDALLDPSCRACPSFTSPKSSLLVAAVLLVLSKGLCVLDPVALLVALLDGAVKAVVYPSGQSSVIGYLLLDLWRSLQLQMGVLRASCPHIPTALCVLVRQIRHVNDQLRDMVVDTT